MTKNLFLACPLFIAIAVSSACSGQPTVPSEKFGAAVRDVMEYQIHNYEAALHPTPDAVEGSDPDRLKAVLDAYRGDVGEPQQVPQPININVGGR